MHIYTSSRCNVSIKVHSKGTLRLYIEKYFLHVNVRLHRARIIQENILNSVDQFYTGHHIMLLGNIKIHNKWITERKQWNSVSLFYTSPYYSPGQHKDTYSKNNEGKKWNSVDLFYSSCLITLQGNIKMHTERITQGKKMELGWSVLHQSPYSPQGQHKNAHRKNNAGKTWNYSPNLAPIDY